MAAKAVSAQQLRDGAKEVIPTEEDLKYDRFKWNSADLPYDPKHSYCIGKLARTLIDEYSKLQKSCHVHSGINHTGVPFAMSYMDMSEVPGWICDSYHKNKLADTCPCIEGVGWAKYPYDIMDWYNWMFFGGRQPLWD